MKPSILHQVSAAFDERSAFLHVALGVVSLERRIRSSLTATAPAAPSMQLSATDAEGGVDQELLHWLLGLVFLSRRLRRLAPALRACRSRRGKRAATMRRNLSLRELLE